MENCLLTKLKGVVDNDNLEILGALTLTLNPNAGIKPVIISGDVHYYIKGSGKIYTDSGGTTEMEQPVAGSGLTRYIGNAAAGDKLIITNKYALVKIHASQGNIFSGTIIDDAKYLNALQVLSPTTGVFAIDLDELTRFSKDITTITIYGSIGTKGSFETIVENLIGLGRNSGTLSIAGYNLNVTLNGIVKFTNYNERTNAYIITFSGNTATIVYQNVTVASFNGTEWTYPD